MSEIEIKHLKSYSELINSLPEDEKKCAEIMCKQSAEAQEERLHELYLSQDKTTYLVCFNNGFAYSHISALDLHNYLKLKIEYKKICDNRETYLEDLRKEQFSRAIINTDEITKAAKLHFLETEPYINEIIKGLQLYPFPNVDIEKIIDETTNQVVKI